MQWDYLKLSPFGWFGRVIIHLPLVLVEADVEDFVE